MIDRRLSDLIGLIYEAALRPELWTDALALVTAVAPCVVASLYSHDLVTRSPTFHQSYGATASSIEAYIEKWADSNPIIDAMAKLDPGDVGGLASILDYDAFTQTAFFKDWGRPNGYCDAINIMLERTPTRVASVSLIRGDDHGLADAATIERQTILAPHFLRAVRVGRALDHASVKERTVGAMLDAFAAPVLLVGEQGDVVHANTSAAALVGDGMAGAPLRQLLREAAASRDDTVRPSAFWQAPSGERFVCHSMPLPLDGWSVAPTVVVFQGVGRTDEAIKAAAATFGLTKREVDVLLGIVEIGGITATAATLGISKQTAKSHLRTIFQKTGTHRQSEIVKLVSALMTPLRSV